MKRFLKQFCYREEGFTLIELLLWLSPTWGKFIGEGKTESYQAELQGVQTAVM